MSQLAAVFITLACVAASPDETLEQVRRFMAADRVEAAEEVLRKAVREQTGNGRLRHTLARVLAYDGRIDDAIRLLKEGVTDDADDQTRLNLLMLAGELSLSRAEDGPTVTHRRGTVTYSPEKPGSDKAAFVKKHLAVAEASFRQAMEINPNNAEIVTRLARTLTLAQRSEAALELWSKRLKQAPNDREALIQSASLRLRLGQADTAVELLKGALEERPNDTEVLELLVRHYETTEEAETISYWKARLDFSRRVPSFVRMEYNENNVGRLDSLASRNRVEELLRQKTPESSELLAVYCWSHPHNDIEDRAFVELGDRRANELLQGLLDHAGSTCTIRGAAAQLARSKPAGLFERLVRMLPGDRRSFGMHMDIANALDVLGDARAVPDLTAVLAPETNEEPDREMAMMYDLDGACCRAAMALGAFDTVDSRQALLKGLPNPRVSLACAGALYRLTGDAKYRAALEKAAAQDDLNAWRVLKRLTNKLPEDQALKVTLQQLEERLKANAKTRGK